MSNPNVSPSVNARLGAMEALAAADPDEAATVSRTPAIYSVGGLWVIRDPEGALHVVPNHYLGWRNRRPYRGPQAALRGNQVGRWNSMFLGVPFERQLAR